MSPFQDNLSVQISQEAKDDSVWFLILASGLAIAIIDVMATINLDDTMIREGQSAGILLDQSLRLILAN